METMTTADRRQQKTTEKKLFSDLFPCNVGHQVAAVYNSWDV